MLVGFSVANKSANVQPDRLPVNRHTWSSDAYVRVREEIMLQLMYPRLDVNVSKGTLDNAYEG